MNYRLMAVDMDGTLLNSRKEISSEDVYAVNRALAAGKEVVFSTGRCLGELRPFFPLFPKMRYVLCESGACIYDLRKGEAIVQKYIPQAADKILAYAEQRDIMPQVLTNGQAVMSRRDVDNLGHFLMEHYEGHFRKNGLLVEDVYRYCRENKSRLEKICLYHPSEEARAETKEVFQDAPVTAILAESTSLEISPPYTDKGTGLDELCTLMGIPITATIAVGDSANDLCVLQKAGLSVAMGNATEEVKAVCQAIVSDNDHLGVREAIESYLLA